MSYCVNCGVELGESEKRCVLCDCEVINPKKPFTGEEVSLYPNVTNEQISKGNRKFYSILITLFLILPSAISFFLNILYFDEILWSVYVIGAFTFLWVCIVPPIMFKNFSSFLYLLLDYISLLAIIFIIENLFFDYDWFFNLALPIITVLWILINIIVVLGGKKIITGFQIPGLVIISAGILCIAIDLFINLKYLSSFKISWSVFVIIPAVIIGLIFVLIERNTAIKEELVKRFHF